MYRLLFPLVTFIFVLVVMFISIWDFPNIRVPYFGVLKIRILLFRVLY